MFERICVGEWKTKGAGKVYVSKVGNKTAHGYTYFGGAVADRISWRSDGMAFDPPDPRYDLVEPWKDPVVPSYGRWQLANKDYAIVQSNVCDFFSHEPVAWYGYREFEPLFLLQWNHKGKAKNNPDLSLETKLEDGQELKPSIGRWKLFTGDIAILSLQDDEGNWLGYIEPKKDWVHRWTANGVYASGTDTRYNLARKIEDAFKVTTIGIYRTKNGNKVEITSFDSGDPRYPVRGKVIGSAADDTWTIDGQYDSGFGDHGMNIVERIDDLPPPKVRMAHALFKNYHNNIVQTPELFESEEKAKAFCGKSFLLWPARENDWYEL